MKANSQCDHDYKVYDNDTFCVYTILTNSNI